MRATNLALTVKENLKSNKLLGWLISELTSSKFVDRMLLEDAVVYTGLLVSQDWIGLEVF